VDTWWQTETGMIMLAPLPGAIATKPGSATRPIPGVFPEIVDKQGRALPANQGGLLVIRNPWPSMLRTIYGDDARYQQQYWSQIPHSYVTADGARQDEDGYFWIMGRVELAGGDGLLETIARAEPELVLMDIQLPGKDGFALLAEIRASPHRGLRVLALTAHAMSGDRERALGAGFDGYITKPIEIRRFPELVNRALAGEPVTH
jgi:CheY-like chemotaxis protein